MTYEKGEGGEHPRGTSTSVWKRKRLRVGGRCRRKNGNHIDRRQRRLAEVDFVEEAADPPP